MKLELQYNKIGKAYLDSQRKYHSKKGLENGLRFILNKVGKAKNKTILDAGCGGGFCIPYYEKLHPKAVFGIDTSEFMIRTAKNIAARPELITKQTIEKTGFKPNTFDFIVSRFALHYLKKFDKFYTEMHRILKTRGKLIILVNHPLKDYSNQKNKIYGKQEITKIKAHSDHVPLFIPSHTFKQYFSDTFLKLFILEGIFESPTKPVKKKFIPDGLAFFATKR